MCICVHSDIHLHIINKTRTVRNRTPDHEDDTAPQTFLTTKLTITRGGPSVRGEESKSGVEGMVAVNSPFSLYALLYPPA